MATWLWSSSDCLVTYPWVLLRSSRAVACLAVLMGGYCQVGQEQKRLRSP